MSEFKRFSSPSDLPAAHSVKRSRESSPDAHSISDENAVDVPARAKLLLVDFRSGEAVHHHPEVLPFLEEGWLVKAASPRVTREGTRLLVVLAPPGSLAGFPARTLHSDAE